MSVTRAQLIGNVPLGSASAPTFTFANDPNTGIYSPGADQLALVTGGTSRITIDSSGNVTIANRINIPLGSAAAPSIYFAGDTNTGIWSPTGDTIALSTGGSERLRLDSSGRLGIGTTSPGALLEASSNTGSASITPTEVRISSTTDANDWNTSNPWARLAFYSADTTNGARTRVAIDAVQQFANGNVSALSFKTDNGSGTLVERQRISYTGTTTLTSAAATAPLVVNIDTSEAMRIDSSGRLLVGTSSAVGASKGRIQVKGAAGGVDPFAKYVLVSGFDEEAGNISLESSGTNSISINADPDNLRADSLIAFKVDATERMRIDNGGAVYFGTTGAPGATVFGVAINRNGNTGLIEASRNVSGTTAAQAFGGNAGTAYVMGDGDLENTNNRYTGISDIKFKQNIEDATAQWDDIKAIQVRKYELTASPDRKHIGCVAQELEQVCPGLVIDREDQDGVPYKSVAYSVLYMKAVKALQEAMERIETLEAKVAALEAS